MFKCVFTRARVCGGSEWGMCVCSVCVFMHRHMPMCMRWRVRARYRLNVYVLTTLIK